MCANGLRFRSPTHSRRAENEKILGFCTPCESFAPLTLHERPENRAEAFHLLTDIQFFTR
jgi:hypothetical protein